MNVELQNLSLLDHKDYWNYITEDMKTGEQQVKRSKSNKHRGPLLQLLDHIKDRAGIKIN